MCVCEESSYIHIDTLTKINPMKIKLSPYVYSYVEYLSDWCPKMVPSQVRARSLNSQFSFKTGYQTKITEPVILFTNQWKEKSWINEDH